MEIKYVLLMALGCSSLYLESKSEANYASGTSKPCQCYCSYGEGPRDAKPNDPILFTRGIKNLSHEAYDICFCALRDIEKFEKSDLKPNDAELERLNCCANKSRRLPESHDACYHTRRYGELID